MAQDLASQQKKEVEEGKGERTVPARYFVPNTDIYETADALSLVMEVPGVDKKDLDVQLEAGTLKVEARIDYGKYDQLEPLYSEYNVGHYVRSFALSNQIDQSGISAALENGVLTLTLPKAKEATPRRIAIT
jgi:HSP20 family molecular chaperone IbpA